MKWQGVMPAITTGFKQDLSFDAEYTAKHVNWLVDNGCTGIVANGTLGEATSLSFDEKIQVLQTCITAVGDRVPVISGIGAMTTAQAVALAKKATSLGCSGLMILPPYQYSTDWYEMKAHVDAVIEATDTPCMLYNDPDAYGTDFLPEHIAELAADHSHLCAVKEATTDVRRITAIRSLLGERLSISVGMDDILVEGVAAGATSWVAGTANALPKESVALFNYAIQREDDQAFRLYKWMMPLMRLNAAPKFVQMTKLMQQAVGWGNTFVRPPR
jgi:4-hydroxy-tetrahydrodipicolinate synthase